MNQELQTINDELLFTIDQMPVGVMIYRVPGNRIVVANPEMHRILGVELNTLPGSSMKTAFFDIGGKTHYPDQRSVSKDFFPSHHHSDRHVIAKSFEVLIRQPGGDERYVLVNASPVLDKDKRPIAMVSVLQDITSRKAEEEVHRKNEERLDYALKATVDGLWDWNIPNDKGYLSPRYLEIYGYGEDKDLPGDIKHWANMLHPEDKSKALSNLVESIRQQKERYESVYRLKGRDGTYRWIRSRAMPVERDDNGAIIKMVGTHQNITADMEMQQALQRSNERLEIEVEHRTADLKETNQKLATILNGSSEGIWVCDSQGVLISQNRASEKIWEVQSEQIIGKTVEDLMAHGIMDTAIISTVLQTRKPASKVLTINRIKKELLIISTPVFDEIHPEKIKMIIVNERDLTQQNIMRKALEQARIESSSLKDELTELNLRELKKQQIVAVSKEMKEILATALKLARLDVSNILVLGESGTGKGLLAKFIHNNGVRQKKAFIQINCAALPETLLEAELFGYEKGAFTGASDKGKAGLFELAKGGTLFLDEIGELSLKVQAKLLKCLEEKEIMHLGGIKPIPIDCTVIAATNNDLEKQVALGKFRQDLFYRLNVFTLTIPPLRQRPEDIIELISLFLKKYNEQYDIQRKFSTDELERLQHHPFPGNVRELKNTIKRAVVLGGSDTPSRHTVGSDDQKRVNRASVSSGRKRPITDDVVNPFSQKSLSCRVDEFERGLLLEALDRCKSTRELAVFFQTSQTSIVRRLKKHELTHLLNRKKTKRPNSSK